VLGCVDAQPYDTVEEPALMYLATVLPHGSSNLSGKNVLAGANDQEIDGTALVKVVLPVVLVTEFDTWLEESLKPRYIERPSNVIAEYQDLTGCWAGLEDLQVVYYMAVEYEKLEAVQQFATEFKDTRK
jgi:hypothetical protein